MKKKTGCDIVITNLVEKKKRKFTRKDCQAACKMINEVHCQFGINEYEI